MARVSLLTSLFFMTLLCVGCLSGASGQIHFIDDVWQLEAYGATLSVTLNCPDSVTTSSEFSVIMTLQVEDFDPNVDYITDYSLYFGYSSLGGGHNSGSGNDENLTTGQSFTANIGHFEIENDNVGLLPGESIIFPVQVSVEIVVVSTDGTHNQAGAIFPKNIILVAGSDAPTYQYLYIYRLLPVFVGVIILFIILIIGIRYRRTPHD